jgi:multidrug resistance efflux pump
MISARNQCALSLLFTGIVIISGAACNSSGENATPAGLVVVNASRTGTVKRVLVKENMDVTVDTVLIEIAIPSNINGPTANTNRPPVGSPLQNQGKAIADAEQQLQSAAVEVQRIEPLVASGGAPQSHLDAARAQYQQAQERVDGLRRDAQNPQPNPALQQSNNNRGQHAPPSENIVAVRAPVGGNVRVISVRIGQPVKAGETIATISTTR